MKIELKNMKNREKKKRKIIHFRIMSSRFGSDSKENEMSQVSAQQTCVKWWCCRWEEMMSRLSFPLSPPVLALVICHLFPLWSVKHKNCEMTCKMPSEMRCLCVRCGCLGTGRKWENKMKLFSCFWKELERENKLIESLKNFLKNYWSFQKFRKFLNLIFYCFIVVFPFPFSQSQTKLQLYYGINSNHFHHTM